MSSSNDRYRYYRYPTRMYNIMGGSSSDTRPAQLLWLESGPARQTRKRVLVGTYSSDTDSLACSSYILNIDRTSSKDIILGHTMHRLALCCIRGAGKLLGTGSRRDQSVLSCRGCRACYSRHLSRLSAKPHAPFIIVGGKKAYVSAGPSPLASTFLRDWHAGEKPVLGFALTILAEPNLRCLALSQTCLFLSTDDGRRQRP